MRILRCRSAGLPPIRLPPRPHGTLRLRRHQPPVTPTTYDPSTLISDRSGDNHEDLGLWATEEHAVEGMDDRRGSGSLASSSSGDAIAYPWLFNNSAAAVSDIGTRRRYAATVSVIEDFSSSHCHAMMWIIMLQYLNVCCIAWPCVACAHASTVAFGTIILVSPA